MMNRTNLRSALRGLSVFVEGIGFLGKVGDIETPAVEFEMIEDGNMGRKIDTGLLKPMEAKITIYDHNELLIQVVGKRLRETASFVIKTSTASDKKEQNIYIEITAHVEKQEMENPKEAGKETGITLSLAVTGYKLEIDGKEVYDLDVDRYICKIDGKDHYETLRKHLM